MAVQGVNASFVDTLEWMWEEGFSAKAWKAQTLPVQEYIPWDEVPLSSIKSPCIAIVVYLILVKGIPVIRAGSPPISFPRTLLIHNIFLTATSIFMFVGLSSAVAGVWLTHGFWAIWSDPQWILPSSTISFWCYIFYLSKYYELLDTFFLIMKNKKPRLVQTWHHTCVLLLFWSFENARMTNHWFLAFCNTFVHIFVYGYFTCSTLGITVSWKKYITLMQISQFVADILFAIIFPYFREWGWTHGDPGPFLLGNFIGVTFIILFTQVYYEIASAKRAAAKENKSLKSA